MDTVGLYKHTKLITVAGDMISDMFAASTVPVELLCLTLLLIAHFLLFWGTPDPELPRYPTSKHWISELRQYFLIIFEVLKNSARDLWESHFFTRLHLQGNGGPPELIVQDRLRMSDVTIYEIFSVRSIIVLFWS